MVVTLAIFAFSYLQNGTIIGSVNPADKATDVWAINHADTVKVKLSDGNFSLSVKPGKHTVIIRAIDPYKDAVKKDVEIIDGQVKDLGEMVLELK